MFLMYGCSSSFYLSTMHHDTIYGPEEVVLTVPSDVKIDTLSYSQLKWKLRTDNTFRWNFAQYAMEQPYSWYSNNFRYSYWRPFNSFDVYWNRHNFWYDWAFNYPFNYGWSWNRWNRWNFGWGNWNHWNRPFFHWDNWYNGPWHNPSYNAIWNSSRNNVNVAYINGRRGSRNSLNNNIVSVTGNTVSINGIGIGEIEVTQAATSNFNEAKGILKVFVEKAKVVILDTDGDGVPDTDDFVIDDNRIFSPSQFRFDADAWGTVMYKKKNNGQLDEFHGNVGSGYITPELDASPIGWDANITWKARTDASWITLTLTAASVVELEKIVMELKKLL